MGQWLTFHGPVILSYILKTIWWINVVFEILIQCDPNIDQTLTWNYICRSVTYISWPSDFALYLDYLMDKCRNWKIGSMWCKASSHKMYVGQWPTFYGLVILSYILKTTWWINVVLEILIQCDTNTELKLCRSVTYISLSSDFTLYLEDYLMDKCHNWNTGYMWCKDLTHKMYVCQWSTFHGPVILSYILKTIWWINIVLEILIQCDTNIELNYICRPVTYISWSSDFALYLED